MTPYATQPDAAMLIDLVRRIVEVAHPTRIVLFGSAARGQMGPNSDLDVLVILPDGVDVSGLERAMYSNMWGFGFATDIVAVTESDVREFGDNPCLIIHAALGEGREVYRAAG
jgi:UTP:GlnB (protein PII) uridylyltransferase